MNFRHLHTLEERLELMGKLADKFRQRAEQIDREGAFPFDHIEELKKTGYTTLTTPRTYGGEEISLYEMVRLQEKLATGDGSTALSIGWHVGIMKNLSEKNSWDETVFRKLCEEVMNGALINSAATEPATGSPTRGGVFQTVAVRSGEGWVINGRKTFTTLAPALDLILVNATVQEKGTVEGKELGAEEDRAQGTVESKEQGTAEQGTGTVKTAEDRAQVRAATFLVRRNTEGVHIEETWDSVAMRGTGSHDLILKDVYVSDSCLVEWLEPEHKRASGWLLHIPACYLGIAQAAQNYAIQFAHNYRPNSLRGGSIIDLPNVQLKIGEMELELMRAREYLYAIAKRWDESDDQGRQKMKPDLGAVKYTVTNAALKVVDLAMRVVGAHSLALSNPLQRYYRDVRAGLHNPPMDDMTIQLLAKTAIGRETSR